MVSVICRHLILPFFVFATTASPEKSGAAEVTQHICTDTRCTASPSEMLGAWESIDKRVSHQYLIILKDGRIARITTARKLEKVNKSLLITIINSGTVEEGNITGWEKCQLSEGEISVQASSENPEQEKLSVFVPVNPGDIAEKSGDAPGTTFIIVGNISTRLTKAPPAFIPRAYRRLPD